MAPVFSGDAGDAGDSQDAAWRPPAPAPSRTEHVDGYEDLVEVGRGGDSVVYRAQQTSMQRDVAIKVVDVADPARAARFAREIQITVELGRQHPNIVTVLDVATTTEGRPAIVMDFFEGGTLHDRLRVHGPLPAEEVTRIGVVLADALSFAHERGVLHRDVKPQNVLVLPTSWVLTDFGIARLVDSEHTSSAETFTFRHAAPQVLDGQPPSEADDVWSLGSTLYTLLDGRPPFASPDPDDDSALAYLRRARTEPHRALRVVGAEPLVEVIDRCLSKDVATRWASAGELRDALLALRSSAWEPGSTATPATPAAPAAPAAPATAPPEPTPEPGAERWPEPQPAPAPIARSAAPGLGALDPGIGGDPAEPTGRPPEQEPGGPRSVSPIDPGAETGTDTDAATNGPRRRLPLVLVGAALAIGLFLGIIGAALRGQGEDDPVAATTTADPGPGVVPALPTDPGEVPRDRTRPSRDLRMVLLTFDYRASVLDLEWTDPSDGEGQFYLMRIGEDGATVPVLQFPAGTTSARTQVSLPPGDACYYMMVRLVDGSYGIDDKGRCPVIEGTSIAERD